MVNKAIIVGYLGADPDVKYLPSGDPVASMSIATSERWKDKDGERQEKTEWHRVVAFNRLADICGQYLSKGSLVYIEGRIQTRSWDDRETGVRRYATEIVATTLKMLPSGSGNKESNGTDHGRPSGAPSYSKPSDYEDDIPF